jgi:hypothetical protein
MPSDEDPVSKRVNEAVQRLVEEFTGKIPSETVVRSAAEVIGEYKNARVTDFIPLLVYRSTREHLGALTQAQVHADRGTLGGT